MEPFMGRLWKYHGSYGVPKWNWSRPRAKIAKLAKLALHFTTALLQASERRSKSKTLKLATFGDGARIEGRTDDRDAITIFTFSLFLSFCTHART